jgi:hypothetical protein
MGRNCYSIVKKHDLLYVKRRFKSRLINFSCRHARGCFSLAIHRKTNKEKIMPRPHQEISVVAMLCAIVGVCCMLPATITFATESEASTAARDFGGLSQAGNHAIVDVALVRSALF